MEKLKLWGCSYEGRRGREGEGRGIGGGGWAVVMARAMPGNYASIIYK